MCVYVYIYILERTCRFTATELSEPVVWFSYVVLTGSMFCLCVFFLLYFRLMVGCEVEGGLWVALGRSRGLCVRSWVALGASAGGLGSLLGPPWAVLDSSWGLCGRSWVALGASAGGLGSLFGPLWAVLGRSWALCGRSWAALGQSSPAYGADQGLSWRLLGPM